MRADGDRAAIIDAEGATADELTTEFSLKADTASETYFGLCLALLEADISVAQELLRYVDPDDATPIAPVPLPERAESQSREIAAPTSEVHRTDSLDAIFERILASPTSNVSLRAREGWATSLRFWRDVHGDIGWQDIGRSQVTEWLEMIAQRPSRATKVDDALPLPELVARYQGKEDVPRLTGRTVRKHAAQLATIWNRAYRRGWIGDKPNPFIGHDIRTDSRTGGNPLTAEELAAIFSLPVFTKGERPKRGRGEASFWIPLFALCTGARPAEIAQLVDFR